MKKNYRLPYKQEPRQRYWLSRTFYYLMCRRSTVTGEPELDQLGELTGVDIQPLYQMETYQNEDALAWALGEARGKREREQIRREAAAANANLAGNLDNVLAIIEGLLSKLMAIDNLPGQLDAGHRDTLNNAVYFADFLREAGTGEIEYLDNNFGQDLRAFQWFLHFAKSHGSTMVYFEYM